EGQAARDVCADVEECHKRRRVRIRRKSRSLPLGHYATAIGFTSRRDDAGKFLRQGIAVSSHPVAREIRLPIGCPWCSAIHKHAALVVAWNARLLILRPLGQERTG